jgi:hypothetical protein
MMATPAVVLALVLAMTAVGTSALLWSWPTYGKVRPGFELLVGSTVALLAWSGWAALRGPVERVLALDPDSVVVQTRPLLAAFLGLTLVAVVGRLLRLPPLLVRIVGNVASLVGLAALVPLAQLRADGGGAGGFAQGAVELLLGAALLGSIWFGMLLGHWYLVERRLTNRPMIVTAWINVAVIGAGLASVLLSGRNPAPCQGLEGAAFQQCSLLFAPVLRIGSMTLVLGLGVLALLALISGFNVKLAREGGRSIQAATGMFYLAVILAPAVEFAAKVRFFTAG